MAFGQKLEVRFKSGLFANTTVTPFIGPITKDIEVEWPGVEWFFQAWKATDPEVREQIRKAPSWRAAKDLGRWVPLRQGWDTGEPVEGQTRIRVMLQGMRLKFVQHDEARGALLATETRWLVEDRPDPFWGVGPDGKGPNWCGRCLMVVRGELDPANQDVPF